MGKGVKKWDYEYTKYFIEVESESGCKLVSSSFKNTDDRVIIKCSCGENFELILGSFIWKKKRTCKKCVIEVDRKRKTKTHDQFVKEVEELHGNEIIFITKYIKAHDKVLIEYKDCGHRWEMFPNSILRGSKCRDCARNVGSGKRRKTHEIFEREVNEKYHNSFELLTKYSGSTKKIKVRHLPCGNVFDVFASSLLDSGGCKNCGLVKAGLKKRKTPLEFEDEIKILYGEEYRLSVPYNHSKEKVNIQHIKCGNEISILPAPLLKGRHLCIKCYGLSSRKTNQEFLEEALIIAGDEYEILDDYVKSDIKILVKHNKCGYEYLVTPSGFLKGTKCPQCNPDVLAKPPEQYMQEVKNLVGDEYTLLTPYRRSGIKVIFRHEKCGYEYEVSANDFLSGSRCPSCNGSKGEHKIMSFLKENNLVILKEKKFEDCVNKLRLPFDFFVESRILIEYDGIGHFEPIDFAGRGLEWATKNMLYTQENDKIKDAYCIEKGITLYRIPYWEFKNIELITEALLIREGVMPKKDNLLVNYNFNELKKYRVDENWDRGRYVLSNPKNKQIEVSVY